VDAGSLESVVNNLVQDYGLKMCRYCGVSVFNVVFGQSLLLLFYKALGWPAAIANVAAVCISAGPAYLLSRKWVWKQTGSHSVRDEIAPFWGMALLGLLLSTLMVSLAADRWDSGLAVSAANLFAFGIVWVVKFVVLEKIMWKQPTLEVVAIDVERA
jgi:putative flippase GtrA